MITSSNHDLESPCVQEASVLLPCGLKRTSWLCLLGCQTGCPCWQQLAPEGLRVSLRPACTCVSKCQGRCYYVPLPFVNPSGISVVTRVQLFLRAGLRSEQCFLLCGPLVLFLWCWGLNPEPVCPCALPLSHTPTAVCHLLPPQLFCYFVCVSWNGK